jgi:glutamyl-tRNA synthetase
MLHVGNARTALFDWLYARGQGGVTLLRIEDTDESRNHPEWVDVIYRSLEWLGLDWDGEPRFQSASFEAHRERAEKLHADGFAYYCDCVKEDVEARKEAAGGKTPGYDSFCRERGLGPGPGRVLRFRVPESGTLLRRDVIRGETEIDLATVEDFAILRSSGVPLYVLANALDDIDDGITHVLRGEDHLANVVKQMLIRQALGHGDIVWAHLPMIVNDQRKKLSKRRDKVALDSYRVDGYLPEAMVNYLATLGWSPPSAGDDEIAPVGDMVATFRLEDVNSSPAQFDERKLAAFNGHYLRELPEAEFVERAAAFFGDREVLRQMAAHVQTRVERLSDLPSMLDFLVLDEPVVDDASWAKATKDPAVAQAILSDTLSVYGASGSEWSAPALHAGLAEVAERHGLGLAKAQAPVRVAVTGRTVGPPLFESLEVLGRDATLSRLRAALDRLGRAAS